MLPNTPKRFFVCLALSRSGKWNSFYCGGAAGENAYPGGIFGSSRFFLVVWPPSVLVLLGRFGVLRGGRRQFAMMSLCLLGPCKTVRDSETAG